MSASTTPTAIRADEASEARVGEDRAREDQADEERSVEPCVAKLKALADPTRLAVVEELLLGPRNVGDLARLLRVEQTLLSHHLRTLREIGILTARREGKTVVYELSDDVRTDARGSLELGCCNISFKS